MKVEKPVFEEQTFFSSGQKGYVGYRIPALAVSTRGTILAFAEGRKDGRGDYADINMALRRSTDGGRTWTDTRFIVDDGTHTMGNPCPVVDAHDGSILLVFCRDNKQVFVTRSTDDGESWTEPEDITKQATDSRVYFVYTGPGHGIQLNSGRLLIPSSCDYGKKIGDMQGSYALLSDDHGKSWRMGGFLEPDTTDECEAVELSDGRVYMNARSRQDRKQRGCAFSNDGGESWSAVRFDSALPEPSCQGSVIGIPEDRILCSCPANPYGRAILTVRMSSDGAKTWPVSRVVHQGAAAYSDLAFTRDNEVLCLYETDDYTRIVLARFNLEWLTDTAERC